MSYTIKQMAEKVGIPESTVRFYRDRHSHYFESTGRGKRRRYTENALQALELIAEEAGKGRTSEEIEAALSNQFMRVIEITEQVAEALHQAEAEANALTIPAEAFVIIADQRKEQAEQRQIIEEQRARIDELEKRLEEVVKMVEDQQHKKRGLFGWLKG